MIFIKIYLHLIYRLKVKLNIFLHLRMLKEMSVFVNIDTLKGLYNVSTSNICMHCLYKWTTFLLCSRRFLWTESRKEPVFRKLLIVYTASWEYIRVYFMKRLFCYKLGHYLNFVEKFRRKFIVFVILLYCFFFIFF